MTPAPFLIGLLSVLVTRQLAYHWQSRHWWLPMLSTLAVQLLLVLGLLELSSPWPVVFAVAVLQAAHATLLRLVGKPHGPRSLSLLLTLTVLLLVLGNPALALGPRPCLAQALDQFAAGNALLALVPADTGHRLLVACAALWLAVMEANHPIALLLKRADLMPLAVTEDGPSREPARGRMIGRLERGIVCMLALSGHLSGLGLLLGAKAFARFRDLDKREFAEYVLIGTLLSISAALLIGLLFKPLL